MPAQSTTSADKKLQAQEARRQAALKSASNRGGRRKKPAVASSTNGSTGGVAATNTVSSAPESESKEPFLSSEIAKSSAVSEALSASINNDSGGSETVAAGLEVLCDIADTNPSVLGSDLGNVRQLCQNRRKALSVKGKAAVPSKNSAASVGNSAARAMAYAAGQISSRDLARMRRKEMAATGRGDKPKSRPSGRLRPDSVPPKVETGTTLSGQEVSGTQVERTTSVTGNESGTCRPVTGTEYVGAEQFSEFCGVQPEPNPPKVNISVTGAGRPISGAEPLNSAKVTGDEHGSCSNVTGSEYVGAEKLSAICGVKPSAKPSKVISSFTEQKDISVTGSDEARMNRTTGNEAGAQKQITGSQYSDVGAAKLTINGPSKVALTHTIAGQAVTGTEVGRSAKVTGDEYGGCRPVTGTEYISNEQFSSVCGTIPEPHPGNVGFDKSMQGQRVSGVMVDRANNVTGNEAGSCANLTGSQYGQSKLCGGAAPKVNDMHTLKGSNLTGSSMDLSPKMTGDEQFGCLPVTGIEYYGQEQFAQCPSTPQPAPAKVGFDHTPKGEHVSGTMVGHAENVTGNEHGAVSPVSGTPYVGTKAPHDHGSCCEACAIRDAAQAAGLVPPAPAPVQQPAQVQQAYVAQPVAQAPQYPVQQAIPMAAPVAPQDFSIVSPARAAQVTGNHYQGGGRVTGPGDMAANRVSGTAEFRYPDTHLIAAPAPAQIMTAPPAPAPAPVQEQVSFAPVAEQPAEPNVGNPKRITGEGRDDGIGVTGDNWGRVPGMTGTEGHVAQGRNPSLRSGQAKQPVNNAYHNKAVEHADPANQMVTGSSGNTDTGAVITVSGGARG